MARLRGAVTVIVGIQPDVAFAMVRLGMGMGTVPTALDLEEGLAYLAELSACPGPRRHDARERLEALTRDYRTAFLRYLPRRSEAALTAGYELGRRAVATGRSLLDLVQVHHRILAEVLTGAPSPDTTQVVEAACEYLSEVLSTFDMAHRVLHDPAPEPPVAG